MLTRSLALSTILCAGGCGLTLGVDPSPADSGADTATPPSDTGPHLDADALSPDAMPFDTGAPPDAVTCPTAGTNLTFESSTLGPTDTTGMVVSPAFYGGWRFLVPSCGVVLSEVGFHGDGEPGRFFAAIVRLDDMRAWPVNRDLTGPDVVAIRLFDYPAIRGDHSVPVDVTLDGGWYAVVFGSGGLGATVQRASIVGGHVRVPGAQLPFTLRQSDGEGVMQSGAYRIWALGTAR